jgi:hypothetical protein
MTARRGGGPYRAGGDNMKRLALALIVSLGLVYPAAAAAVETATAGYVQSHLVARWKTPDGYRLRSAVCSPKGALVAHEGRIFAAFWNCIEVDSVSRILWAHVRVSNTPGVGIERPSEYRCDAAYSPVRCPH